MLYNRSLLVIHFKYNSVYMTLSKSLTIPPPKKYVILLIVNSIYLVDSHRMLSVNFCCTLVSTANLEVPPMNKHSSNITVSCDSCLSVIVKQELYQNFSYLSVMCVYSLPCQIIFSYTGRIHFEFSRHSQFNSYTRNILSQFNCSINISSITF